MEALRRDSFFLSAAEGTRFFQMETKRLKMVANFLLKLSDERKEQQQGLWVIGVKLENHYLQFQRFGKKISVKHYSCVVFLNV